MKKSQFIKLVIAVVAGLLFSLGMCMCLIPEWDAFIWGVVLTSIGGIVLAAMGIIALTKNAKGKGSINWKLIGKIAFGVIGALILGLGMCCVMVWNLIIAGTLIGVAGIVMLLCLIPMFLGFKHE